MGYTKFGFDDEEGARGPRGFTGRGILHIHTVDNEDGTISVYYDMTDGTTEGPFIGTFTADHLLALDQITLTGEEMTDKFEVYNDEETPGLVFGVDSVNDNVMIGAQLTLESEPDGILVTDEDGLVSATNTLVNPLTIQPDSNTIAFKVNFPDGSPFVTMNTEPSGSPTYPTMLVFGNIGALGGFQVQDLTRLNGGVQLNALTPNRVLQLDGSSNVISSNALPSGCSATNLALTSPSLAGTSNVTGTLNMNALTPNRVLQLDGSSNVISSNALPSGCSASNISLTNLTLTGFTRISDYIYANGNVDIGSGQYPFTSLFLKSSLYFFNSWADFVYLSVGGSGSGSVIFYSSSDTGSFSPFFDNKCQIGSGDQKWGKLYTKNLTDDGSKVTISTTLSVPSLTASLVMQTDSSKNVITSNTLTGITLAGTTNVSGLTASQIVQTDSSKNLKTSNTLTGITLAGTTNMSSLTSNAILQLDGSNNVFASNTAGFPGAHTKIISTTTTSDWFIPFDSTIGSISTSGAPKSITVGIDKIMANGQALFLYFATGSGTKLTGSSYNYTTAKLVNTTQTAISTTGTSGIIFSPAIASTTEYGSGVMYINWYIPGSGNANINANITFYKEGGTAATSALYQTCAHYSDSIANINDVTGIVIKCILSANIDMGQAEVTMYRP